MQSLDLMVKYTVTNELRFLILDYRHHLTYNSTNTNPYRHMFIQKLTIP